MYNGVSRNNWLLYCPNYHLNVLYCPNYHLDSIVHSVGTNQAKLLCQTLLLTGEGSKTLLVLIKAVYTAVIVIVFDMYVVIL